VNDEIEKRRQCFEKFFTKIGLGKYYKEYEEKARD